MSAAEEIFDLEREYERRLHTDPIFRARVTIVRNVLAELEAMGRLEPSEDGGYAGYIVMAGLDKHSLGTLQSDAWEKGMADAKLQALGITPHVRNPYLPKEPSA